MNEREIAAADALGSTRAEGLEPSKQSLLLVQQWARGEISDAELEAAEDKVVHDATLPPTVSE
jgi:Antitoxin VbhA